MSKKEEGETMVVNGQFIDTRPDKPGFLETNDQHALQFYRCTLCHRVVSLFDIREERGCRFCGCKKIAPTNLTLWEKIVQIVKHPKVWTWKNEMNRI